MLGWRFFFLFLKVNNLVCWSFSYIYIVNMRLKYVVDIKVFFWNVCLNSYEDGCYLDIVYDF